MDKHTKPATVATEIRRMLRREGSEEHAAGVKWFFKEEIQSHGWYTAALRKAARQTRKQILAERDLAFLVKVADQLFDGSVLEEKIFAVFLLENLTGQLGENDFRLFVSWLERISTWADHDALVHDLIAPSIMDDTSRVGCIFRWAKTRNRWNRRAACVSLIRGVRQGLFLRETEQLTKALLTDEDDMVQKGLGWLWRELIKASPKEGVRSLSKFQEKMPRLVLRTACETLPKEERSRILQGVRLRPS
jgi:3-methyladenine DNA glycosylase AlkD